MFAGTTGPKINKDGLTILKASYGIATAMQDVTSDIQNMVQDGELNFTVNAQSIGILDPAPGVAKTFQLQIIINGGQPGLTVYNDGDVVQVSAPAVKTNNTKSSTALSAMSAFWSAFMWFIYSLFGFFFFQSSYLVGTAITRSQKYPEGIAIVGYILGFISLLTFGSFGMIGLPLILGIIRIFRTTDLPLFS